MARIYAAALLLNLFMAPLECSADEPSKQNNERAYKSPQEVFDAYRTANAEKRWRDLYLCLGPRERQGEIMQTVSGCHLSPTPKAKELLKEYRVDSDSVEKAYARRL